MKTFINPTLIFAKYVYKCKTAFANIQVCAQSFECIKCINWLFGWVCQCNTVFKTEYSSKETFNILFFFFFLEKKTIRLNIFELLHLIYLLWICVFLQEHHVEDSYTNKAWMPLLTVADEPYPTDDARPTSPFLAI